MKKIVTLLLAAMMMVGLCMTASAMEAQYSATKAFAAKLDEVDIKYTLHGLDNSGNDVLTIGNRDDNGFSYTLIYFFTEGDENCGIRVWDVIAFDPADLSQVLRVCNSLHNKFRFVTFYVDESDYTVSAAMDLIYRDEAVGDIVLEGTIRMTDILEQGYSMLSVYAK